MFNPLFREDETHVDLYFSDALKPPTSDCWFDGYAEKSKNGKLIAVPPGILLKDERKIWLSKAPCVKGPCLLVFQGVYTYCLIS